MGRLRIAVVCLFVVACTTPSSRGFSGLVIFGDSLSDVGNVYNQTFGLAPQSPPYFSGRYSNGSLWVEDLAIDQGLPVPTRSRGSVASGGGGSDWAYAGTTTGGGTTSYLFFNFPNIGNQIGSFLSGHTPAADQLFVVWGGGNDFINGQTNPSIPVNNVAAHVTALANAGAKNILVPNLPPLGEIPRFHGTTNQASMDSLSSQFNTQLATTLTGLESSLKINIYQLDVGGLFQQLLSNPSQYGFTNVTDSALVGSTVVPNPDQYLFWDDIHPTRVGHNLLAGFASDLLDTHNWTATTDSAAWSATSSWDPSGAPSSRWIVNLLNDAGNDKSAVVSANSTVRRVNIGGSGARMRLQLQSGVTLTASESLTIASNGVIGVTLAGGGAQSRLAIGGATSLDGVLDISLASGFISLPGTSYQVMTFGSKSGDLSVFNDTGFAGLSFDKSYSATALTLVASAVGGDANLDGEIDVNDLSLLAQSWQSSGNWLNGDFDGDGFVDTTDLGILALHWQGGAQSLQAALQRVSLPEPALLSWLGLGLLASRHRARR